MSPPLFTTPRKDGKTEEQAQTDMAAALLEYHVGDDNHTVASAVNQTNNAPEAKAKRPARKRTTKASTSSDTNEAESSPLTRKSARASGKSLAVNPQQSTMSNSDAPPGKKASASSSATTIQKHTGRFAPISKALTQAKYVEKAVKSVKAEDETDVEDAEVQTEASSKGRAKKQAVKAFQGTKSGSGTSVEKPDDAPLDEPWKCANRDCNSGQTWHRRDGPNSFGRKVISNFFGRNKKETTLIDADVWHNFCRKCYQRGTYRVNVNSSKAKCEYYITNIAMQLDRIELWRPEATFTVQLSKGATARLSKYYRERSKNGSDASKAKQAVTKTAQTNSKGKEKPLNLEDAFPIDRLEQFEDGFCNKPPQTFRDIKAILNWTMNLTESGQIDSMPPMEFLIKKQGPGEQVVDPSTNYDRWCAREDSRGKQGVESDGEESDDSDDDGATEEDNAGKAVTAVGMEDDQGVTSDSEDSDDEESSEPATPPPPPRKYKLSPVNPGGFVKPLSTTYGASPGSGAANKRKRNESFSDDTASEGTPSKRQK